MGSKGITHLFSKGRFHPLCPHCFKGPCLQILLSLIARFFFFSLSNIICIWKFPCGKLIPHSRAIKLQQAKVTGEITIIEASLEVLCLIFRILSVRKIILQRQTQGRYHLLHSALYLNGWEYSALLSNSFYRQAVYVSHLHFLDPKEKVSPFICKMVFF